jgi:hypothetical protein
VTSLFRDKSAHDVDRTMAHFARRPMYYTDATLGWYLPSWESLRAGFQQSMPTWPASARSYATRLIGDERSAIVLFTDTPEMFGHELRIMAAVDFYDGKAVRQVDYWDGRHATVEGTDQLRVPDDQFPHTFGEEAVPSQSAPIIGEVAARLIAGEVVGLFAEDAVFEDLTLRIELVGRQSITGYLDRASTSVPYRGAIRHMVGSVQGGGFEWMRPNGTPSHGIVSFELDSRQKITRLTSMWDGSRLTSRWTSGSIGPQCRPVRQLRDGYLSWSAPVIEKAEVEDPASEGAYRTPPAQKPVCRRRCRHHLERAGPHCDHSAKRHHPYQCSPSAHVVGVVRTGCRFG